jgi:hypothetical protein
MTDTKKLFTIDSILLSTSSKNLPDYPNKRSDCVSKTRKNFIKFKNKNHENILPSSTTVPSFHSIKNSSNNLNSTSSSSSGSSNSSIANGSESSDENIKYMMSDESEIRNNTTKNVQMIRNCYYQNPAMMHQAYAFVQHHGVYQASGANFSPFIQNFYNSIMPVAHDLQSIYQSQTNQGSSGKQKKFLKSKLACRYYFSKHICPKKF